MDNHQASSSIV